MRELCTGPQDRTACAAATESQGGMDAAKLPFEQWNNAVISGENTIQYLNNPIKQFYLF